MDELTIFGAPFSLDHGSSCSTRKPKNFRWGSNPDSRVFILADRTIPMCLNTNLKDKIFYGWIVESFQIVPDLMEFIQKNKEQLFMKLRGIFTCSDELCSQDPRFIKIPPGSNLPWTDLADCKIYDKSKNVSMLSSAKNYAKGHKIRWNIATALKNRIDIFGGVVNTKVVGQDIGMHHKSKLEALKDYRFSVTIENDNHSGYYTEKITDCFATGTIPIYWGDPSIGKIFDSKGIITIDDPNDIYWIPNLGEQEYLDRINSINKNFEIVMNLQMGDEGIWEYIQSHS
jgi:hypothetical protein